jgi:hypothetical protein
MCIITSPWSQLVMPLMRFKDAGMLGKMFKAWHHTIRFDSISIHWLNTSKQMNTFLIFFADLL